MLVLINRVKKRRVEICLPTSEMQTNVQSNFFQEKMMRRTETELEDGNKMYDECGRCIQSCIVFSSRKKTLM